MKKLKETLNLPSTGFSMKANLAQKEPEILKFWEEMDLYSKISEKNKNKPKFILHDGPPYANGPIHLGHVVNKVLKDIIIRTASQRLRPIILTTATTVIGLLPLASGF